jgi:hypothetical protein
MPLVMRFFHVATSARCTVLTLLLALAPVVSLSAWPGEPGPAGWRNLLKIDFTRLPAGLATEYQDNGEVVARLSLSADVKRSGERCLQIERLGKQGFCRPILAEAPVTPGGRYYFTCWIKSPVIGSVPAVFFERFNAAGKFAGRDLADMVTQPPDMILRYGGWVSWLPYMTADPAGFNRLEWEFTVPDGVTALKLGVDFGGVIGSAWFDDFGLYALDEEAASAP